MRSKLVKVVLGCGFVAALVAPALALFPSIARAADACADPNDSLRASLHYTEAGPDKTMTLKGQAFLSNVAFPNFYFHAATAHGILRHNGVEIGKRDFLGVS